jgi:lysophospholipase L1-like esterase
MAETMENLAHNPGEAALKCATAEADAAVCLRDWVSFRSILVIGRLAILAISVAACSSPPAANPGALSGEIGPADERIHYEGRIDWRDSQQPSMSFPGSAAVVHFHGSGFDARLSTTITDHIQVVVDGQPAAAFALTKAPALYAIARDLPAAEHTVILYKCTETNRGTVRFYGLRLQPGTRLLPVPRAKHCIEFIGDSITCGYGDLGANQHEPVSAANSNWYFSYGAIAARELGAEQVTVAVSGIRLTQSADWDAMPSVYRRVHSFDRGYPWDFNRGPVPDVVVINLATNDFRKDPPDESGWTKALEGFLGFVRSRRPSAEIYVADGPMMGPGPDLDHLRAWNREVVAKRRASGDSRCHTMDFAVQQAEDGYGSDWHPSVKTHMKMADQLVAAIRADTDW